MSLAPVIHVTLMQFCVVDRAVVLVSHFQLTLVGINSPFVPQSMGPDKLLNLSINEYRFR